MATPSARKASTRAASASNIGKSTKSSKPQQTHETSHASLVDEMKQQHREVEALLTQSNPEQDLTGIVEKICSAWIPHTVIEEQIIIPALQENGANEPALAEAEVRRDLVKVLLADLQEDPTGPEAAAKFAVLSSELEQLIEVEERPETGVLALADSHDVDLDALKPQVDARKSEMQSNTEGDSMNALEPTTLRLHGTRAERQEEEYSNMPYDSNVRERDERGRFESDDDRRGGYRSRGNDRERDENGRFMSDDDRGNRSRSSRDYDDDYRRSGSNGGGPGRDEEGRFTSRGYSSRSSRYDDDDRRGRGDDRGQGGWFGDPQGHSEASRRGWESREGAGYSSRSSRYDDDGRRGGRSSNDRGQGGWFGDSEGHSEAAREGWEDRRGGGYSSRSSRYDDDDRRSGRSEGRGWYGDPEGHSEAAREGWEDRRGYSSRSSRYDEDDRRGGGRGHGGWFGDPQGHSEASRRGWEDRR